MATSISRRQFLATTAAVGASALLPGTASAGVHSTPAGSTPYWNRVLILIELDGGNDGLNTVIPFDVSEYKALRPKLRYNASDLSATMLNGRKGKYLTNGVDTPQDFALNPKMTHLKAAWNPEAGKENIDDLAIVLGVGYESANLSHFRSMDIWNGGATADDFPTSNWLGRLFNGITLPNSLTAHGALLSRYSSNPLRDDKSRYLAMANPYEFIKRSYEMKDADPGTVDSPHFKHLLSTAHEVYEASGKFRTSLTTLKSNPSNPAVADDYLYTPPTFKPSPNITFNTNSAFERGCKAIAEMIATNRDGSSSDIVDDNKRLQIPVFKIQIGGFDTHSAQKTQTLDRHGGLLEQVSSGMASIRAALKQFPGLWERTLIMTYSEFGRRVEENGSDGTDHGTANCHLLLGGGIKGGFYGAQPGLTKGVDLDPRGNLKYNVDYRQLYATAAAWLGLSTANDTGGLKDIDALTCFA